MRKVYFDLNTIIVIITDDRLIDCAIETQSIASLRNQQLNAFENNTGQGANFCLINCWLPPVETQCLAYLELMESIKIADCTFDLKFMNVFK